MCQNVEKINDANKKLSLISRIQDKGLETTICEPNQDTWHTPRTAWSKLIKKIFAIFMQYESVWKNCFKTNIP